MITSEQYIKRLHATARKEALAFIVMEARRIMPNGWTLLLNSDEVSLTDPGGYHCAAVTDDYSKIIYGIPQGLRGLVKATAAFRDRFGSARETITNRGVIIRLKA